MVDNPGRLLEAFAAAGADGLTVHVELGDPRPLLAEIANLGLRRGLAFEPGTPYEAVEPYLADIDLLLVMSVHTGFGGQPFIPEVLDKVRAARKEIDARGLPIEIEIDGGIKIDNAARATEAGVDILVSGTGIFGAEDPAAAARAIRAAAS
jgi:ribulose-phosphate 3-epimerase